MNIPPRVCVLHKAMMHPTILDQTSWSSGLPARSVERLSHVCPALLRLLWFVTTATPSQLPTALPFVPAPLPQLMDSISYQVSAHQSTAKHGATLPL